MVLDKPPFVLRPDSLYSFSATDAGNLGLFWPLVNVFLPRLQFSRAAARLDISLVRDIGASVTDTEYSFEVMCPQGYAHTAKLVWFWQAWGFYHLGLTSLVQKGRFFRLYVSTQSAGSHLLGVIARELVRLEDRKTSMADWLSGRKEAGL